MEYTKTYHVSYLIIYLVKLNLMMFKSLDIFGSPKRKEYFPKTRIYVVCNKIKINFGVKH